MSKNPKLCKLCRERPAEIPDRNGPPGRLVKAVCRICHSKRLKRDLERAWYSRRCGDYGEGNQR